MYGIPGSLFSIGKTYSTPGALDAMQEAGASGIALLHRHQTGDWSEMAPEDQTANRLATEHGDRVFSAYTVRGVKFWVITEADRSTTTILLPSEY